VRVIDYYNDLPTRKTAALDNIITNIPGHEVHCGTQDNALSDHLGLWSSIVVSKQVINHGHSLISYRSLSERNILALRDSLLNYDYCDMLSNSASSVQAWGHFMNS